MCSSFGGHTKYFFFDPKMIPLIWTDNPGLVMAKVDKNVIHALKLGNKASRPIGHYI